MSILYIILALLGLSFLVFIHELGHYFVARRVGMKVEVFSIGFGPALYKWDRDGVRWQISLLPFGGYVKIKGMEKEGDKEPYEIPDGFFAKKPIDRIKVAFMGPLVNILFAFFIFCVIYLGGGRAKPFSEFTHLVGWINPESTLAEAGLEAGDEIACVGAQNYNGYKDLLIGALLKDKTLKVSGEKIDYFDETRTPFSYSVPNSGEEEKAFSLMLPASYLVYQNSQEMPLLEGLKPGDRVVWADGEILFSAKQLSELVNSGTALLTVSRGNRTFLARVPRVLIRDIHLTEKELGELDDWQHVVGLTGDPKTRYYFPYEIDHRGRIEGYYFFLDESLKSRAPRAEGSFPETTDLQMGDHIIAVDGIPTETSYDIFKQLQKRHVSLIVQEGKESETLLPYQVADRAFVEDVDWDHVLALAETIGQKSPRTLGSLKKLPPIEPTRLGDHPVTAEQIKEKIEEVSKIKDKRKQQALLQELHAVQNRLVLGIPLQDQRVIYNPNPFVLFVGVFQETYRTLGSLVTGLLNPKYVAGPVGIIQVMQASWGIGIKEALFWLGAISLNLGILNLLPLPILDGGHICLSFVEMIRKKPLKAKTMQRLIIPFVVLFILFFLFITFHDILRIFR